MQNRYTRLLAMTGILGAAFAGSANGAAAQSAGNGTFQSFFGNSVCTGAVIGSRCGDTFDSTSGTYANISLNSESSLNPNQISVNAVNSLSAAQALANETEKRVEGLRDGEKGKATASNDTIATFGKLNIFASAQGEWTRKSLAAYQMERGFKGSRYKGSLGFDLGLSGGGRIGLLGSYDEYSLTFDGELSVPNFTPQANAGGSKSKTTTLAAFAMFPIGGGGWIDMAAGFGWSSNDFSRRATFVPDVLVPRPGGPAPVVDPKVKVLNVDAFGHAGGSQIFASIGAGFDVGSGANSFGPYARLRYSRTSIEAYQEVDRNLTDLEMAISPQVAKSLVGILGARASHSYSAKWGIVVPQIRVEYEHEFKDEAATSSAYFVKDLDKFLLPISSSRPDTDHFNVGASMVFVLPHGVMPYIDYEALLGYSNFTRHRVTVGLRIEL